MIPEKWAPRNARRVCRQWLKAIAPQLKPTHAFLLSPPHEVFPHTVAAIDLFLEARQQRIIRFESFAESETRIKHNGLAANPVPYCPRGPISQFC